MRNPCRSGEQFWQSLYVLAGLEITHKFQLRDHCMLFDPVSSMPKASQPVAGGHARHERAHRMGRLAHAPRRAASGVLNTIGPFRRGFPLLQPPSVGR